MRRLVVGALMVWVMLGMASGTAGAQAEGSDDPCPINAVSDDVSRGVARFLDSSRAVIDGLNDLRPQIEGRSTFEAGWTADGPTGDFVAGLLDDASALESVSNSLGGAAGELGGIRTVIERFLEELDEKRTAADALALYDVGGATSNPCGIISTMNEVIPLVIQENRELADTGAETGAIVVVALALLSAGIVLTSSARRPKNSNMT